MKAPSDRVLVAVAVAVTACVAALSGYLFFANIGSRWVYGAAVGAMAAAWIARRLRVDRRNVTRSLVLAGVLLSVALVAKVLEHAGWAGSDVAERTNGIVMGAILVALSNAIPKRMSSANELAARRNIGTALVLGGLGYAAAWLVLPLAYAADGAMLVLLAGVVFAGASYFRTRRICRRSVL